MAPSQDEKTTSDQDENIEENAISSDVTQRASDRHEERQQITPDEAAVDDRAGDTAFAQAMRAAAVENDNLERKRFDHEVNEEEQPEDPEFARLMRATEIEFEQLERKRHARESRDKAEKESEAEASANAEADADPKASAEEQKDDAEVAGDESPAVSDSEPSREITNTAQPETETLQEQSDAATTTNDPDDAQDEKLGTVENDNEAPAEVYRSPQEIERLEFAAERKAALTLMTQRLGSKRIGPNMGPNSIRVEVPVEPVNDHALDALVSIAASEKRYEEDAAARNQSIKAAQISTPDQAADIEIEEEEPQAPISILRRVLGLGRRTA